MEIGKSYHIKDEFFELVNDTSLMSNKENGGYRPHYICIKDVKFDNIFWAIPQSTKVEKYRRIVAQKVRKYGKCNTIIIGDFGGNENAFLIQNMFPITEKYIDHVHTVKGMEIVIHRSLGNKIKTNALEVLNIHRCGKNILFTDVDKILDILKNQ